MAGSHYFSQNAQTKDLAMLRRLVRKHLLKLLLTMICCGMTGCATLGKYEASLDSLKGSSDVSLIKSWGPPAEAFDSNGHTFLVYKFSRLKPFGSIANPIGSPANYTTALFCTTVFDIFGGHVVDWAIKGNDCAEWETAFVNQTTL